MQLEDFNAGLVSFLQDSPTPFHVVENMAQILLRAGFQRLYEKDAWQLQQGGRFFVVRQHGSIIAFSLDQSVPDATGLRLAGAHTDSPCLKVKPQPQISDNGYLQLGVEVYGGALLNPWFDRDLALAGQISYLDTNNKLRQRLLNLRHAIAFIPSLAIHLDHDANKKREINKQTDISPILALLPTPESTPKICFNDWLLDYLKQYDQISDLPQDCDVSRILDSDLRFYDSQPAALIGLNREFIVGARLDNILSCYIGLMSLLNAQAGNCVFIANDHEEVGSVSSRGAGGPFLRDVLTRICGQKESLYRILDGSMMISLDNAHGLHPNYINKHDNNHQPIINQGPVIKINANQRYASDFETSAIFRALCEHTSVPVQSFVVRNDMACGSTIGPITAAEIGIKTVDVGVPTLAMHSIRELAGSKDAHALYQVMSEFYNTEMLATS